MKEECIEIAENKSIHYLNNQNTKKPPLLLIHGVNASSKFFKEVFPYLKDDFNLFAIDLRGHGKSFRSDEVYSLENYSNDVKIFIDTVIQKPCDCVGMSLGGRVGLTTAIRFPEALSKLVMVDVGPDISPEGLIRMQKTQEVLPENFENHVKLKEFYDTNYNGVSEDYRKRIMGLAWTEQGDGSYQLSYDKAIWNLPEGMVEEDSAFLNEGAAKLNIPIFLIRGGNSDILSKKAAQSFLKKLQKSEYAEIPNTSHMVMVEEPEKCSKMIKDFLFD